MLKCGEYNSHWKELWELKEPCPQSVLLPSDLWANVDVKGGGKGAHCTKQLLWRGATRSECGDCGLDFETQSVDGPMPPSSLKVTFLTLFSVVEWNVQFNCQLRERKWCTYDKIQNWNWKYGARLDMVKYGAGLYIFYIAKGWNHATGQTRLKGTAIAASSLLASSRSAAGFQFLPSSSHSSTLEGLLLPS